VLPPSPFMSPFLTAPPVSSRLCQSATSTSVRLMIFAAD
jgi:hypothetical protein